MTTHEPLDSVITRVADADVVLVTFAGAGDEYASVPAHAFAGVCRRLAYHHVMVRDRHSLWYHGGIEDGQHSLADAAEWLQTVIESLGASTVMMLGASSGAYAAIVFGALLGVDYVHAFAPQTSLERDYVFANRPVHLDAVREGYERLWAHPAVDEALFDAATVIETLQAHTRYAVHYCEGCESDVEAAVRLRGLDGVTLLPHPCRTHLVTRYLLRHQLLLDVLSLEHQERLVELCRGAG